ncbi:MAG: SPOR domain-containing protein [Cyclobacteriaceae bacterium]|nr:SPOR domain-containing protein [Cyclobacteriaceae bacterium]
MITRSNNKTPKSTTRTLVVRSLPVLLLMLSFACAAQKGSKPYYHEDLYSLRPKLPDVVDTVKQVDLHQKGPVIPTKNVNARVDAVLDSINRFNLTRKFIDGYTIQIYSGQNREDAMNAKKKMVTESIGLSAELEYTQPKFRVRVGSYYSRLEAQKDLVRLKRNFPNAILVPEKILVR